MPLNQRKVFRSIALMACFNLSVSAVAAELGVKITPDIDNVEVMHIGKPVVIQRNQDENANIAPAFAKTSRKCPPACIQPATIAPGVETIGEIEIIDYIRRLSSGDDSILVIDSRTPDKMPTGTIPGAVNIPWNSLMEGQDGVDAFSVADILVNRFGVEEGGSGFDFANAKTLVMFCNGMWCPQSPTNIKLLLSMGYPPEKIKWYRGGMQSWEALGFNTVKLPVVTATK